MSRKISQDLNGTENRIVGALSKLEEFLLNLQVLVQPGLVQGAYKDFNRENREHEEDVSHNELQAEVDLTVSRSTHGDPWAQYCTSP